jgi:adenosine/AMP kinase
MEINLVAMEIPSGTNIILGQSHFIKTAEDVYEALAGTVPSAKFAVAFSEASGDCLVRTEGNDSNLIETAKRNSLSLACGHTFVVLLKGAFPINVLNAIKDIPEVCCIFCATGNPLSVVVAKGDDGCGIIGVIDGSSPKGAETDLDVEARRRLLRRFGYKL